MTRAEAREHLKDILADVPNDKCIDWIEALNLAIKTLEQEPFDIETYCKEHFCVMVDKDVWEKAEKALEQKPKTIQEIQAESEKYQKAFEDGYDHGYAQARFDYEQESKTGHWEWVQYDYNPKLGNWHCSECRCIVIECVDKEEKGGIPLYKYCPQCGAKMQEAEIEG